MYFRTQKMWSSIIVNILGILLSLSFLLHIHVGELFFIPVFLFIALIIGEILVGAHGWKPIDRDIEGAIKKEVTTRYNPLLWLIAISYHLLYAFMSVIVLLIVTKLLFPADIPLLENLQEHSKFCCFLSCGVGLVIPTFPFLN